MAYKALTYGISKLALGALLTLVLGTPAANPSSLASIAPSLRSTAARTLPSESAPWSDADAGALQAQLNAAFAPAAFADAGLVVLAQNGDVLFDRNGDAPLIPASTQKLFTAAAALNVLGPGFRTRTRFAALSPPVHGVIQGPLWLVGGGDPYLTRDDLRAGVSMLARAGVRTIDGPLLVDDSLFSGPEVNARWDPGDVDGGFAAPLSAISLDQGTIEVHVSGAGPGEAAQVSLLPSTSAVSIVQRPSSVDGGADDVEFARVAASHAALSQNDFAVTGRIAQGSEEKLWLPVLDFTHYAGDVTKTMLAQAGVLVRGPVRREVAPLAAVDLWTHPSPPLAGMLGETLHHSNNHAADQLFRLVGAAGGWPGSDQRGAAGVLGELAKLGVPVDALTLYDGSGLSLANRVTAAALASAIGAEIRSRSGSAFLADLALVGKEGTVRDREVHAALGRARAKTGHLQGVDALAGTVLTRTHGRVAFAFIANGALAWGGDVETAQDNALDILAAY